MAALTPVSALTVEYACACGLARGSQFRIDGASAWLKPTKGTLERVQAFARERPGEARDFARRFRALGVSGPAIED